MPNSGAALIHRKSALANLGSIAGHNRIAPLVHCLISCQLQQVGIDILDASTEISNLSQDADRGRAEVLAMADLTGFGNGNLIGAFSYLDQTACTPAQHQRNQNM